jgi:hypothetical protein
MATSLLAAACSKTSRVDAAITPAALKSTGKAVAVLRIGSASPVCINVAVLFGTREGEGFRRGQSINVANVGSILEPAVAEVELDAGEHHIIGYGCAKAHGVSIIAHKTDGQIYGTSFASFKLEPGEIVNLGFLHMNVSRYGRNALGRPIDTVVHVTDWPLAELERYKQKRPEIYAKMSTRLLTITDRGPHTPSGDECTTLKAMKAEGKVQTLPPSCA